MTNERYDVVIVGGGPGGLSAALALGRARKRVLLCDGGPRRNAAAVHMNNFVSRDGTPPQLFRDIAREQLGKYPNVSATDAAVTAVTGARGQFQVALIGASVNARRVLLCTGMIDETPDIEGFRELWGSSIFQCPYCHGWEIGDRRWGYLGRAGDAQHFVRFALMARGWTSQLVAFTGGAFEVTPEDRARLDAVGVRLETAAVQRLVTRHGELEAVQLVGGRSVPCDALFAHPPQRQVELVRSLGLALDDEGYVRVDPMTRETSVPGIYAAGDLTTRMQSAILAAAAGMQAVAMLNAELTIEQPLATASA